VTFDDVVLGNYSGPTRCVLNGRVRTRGLTSGEP
jgi:hypothetical protein